MNDQSNLWAWWQSALAGRFGPIHENEPQQGFYRVKNDPVAIWHEGGATMALRAGRPVDAAEVWTYACRKPISHELYTSVMAGGTWPEQIENEVAAAAPAGIGHNSGEPHEVALDELDTLERAWATWLQSIGGTIQDEADDAKADTFQKRFHELMKKADETRGAMKRPHIEAGRKIDAAWRPVIAHAETAKRRIGDVVLPYRRARDEARRAAERAVAAARPVKKGFREVKVLVITDLAQACASILKHDAESPDVINAVRAVARRLLDAGVTVDGVEIRIEQRA